MLLRRKDKCDKTVSLAMYGILLCLNRAAVQTSSYKFEQIMSIICTAGVAFQIYPFCMPYYSLAGSVGKCFLLPELHENVNVVCN